MRPPVRLENTYQMEPSKNFPSGMVKNIIKDVLQGYLAEEKYEPELCRQMTKTLSEVHAYRGLHMGPNNLCYVTRHFLFCPYVDNVAMSLFLKDLDVTFCSFYKSPRWTSTTFKVAVSHFVFYPCRALYRWADLQNVTLMQKSTAYIHNNLASLWVCMHGQY